MILGEIPVEALISFTQDFWAPVKASKMSAAEKYFLIQKSEKENGINSPLIARNPSLFEKMIGSNVQPSDFFEVKTTSFCSNINSK